jgi:hypothetical protein
MLRLDDNVDAEVIAKAQSTRLANQCKFSEPVTRPTMPIFLTKGSGD